MPFESFSDRGYVRHACVHRTAGHAVGAVVGAVKHLAHGGRDDGIERDQDDREADGLKPWTGAVREVGGDMPLIDCLTAATRNRATTKSPHGARVDMSHCLMLITDIIDHC